jgi:hypothetical protein
LQPAHRLSTCAPPHAAHGISRVQARCRVQHSPSKSSRTNSQLLFSKFFAVKLETDDRDEVLRTHEVECDERGQSEANAEAWRRAPPLTSALLYLSRSRSPMPTNVRRVQHPVYHTRRQQVCERVCACTVRAALAHLTSVRPCLSVGRHGAAGDRLCRVHDRGGDLPR